MKGVLGICNGVLGGGTEWVGRIKECLGGRGLRERNEACENILGEELET